MTDIAIAHKDYDVRGGGERLAEDLARTFDAPMYVGRRDPKNVPEASNIDIREIDLGRLAKWGIDRGGVTRSAAYMFSWALQPELSAFDTVILSGNEPLWWMPETEQTVIAYTHSTPRFYYDLFQETRDSFFELAYSMAVRTLYESNVRRPDHFVCNSDVVARRVRRYWNIPRNQISVVYPPVDVDAFDVDEAPTTDRYLYLGRLAGHKRVDEILEAVDGSRYAVDIVGRGPEKESLEKQADHGVAFHGYVSEAEKGRLLSRAKALIMPAAAEDFGIVPIEAMAAGTPVIGVEEGFTQHQIIDGENGLTYSRGAENLRRAIEQFERDGVDWEERRIAAFAERFHPHRFREEMRGIVDRVRAETAVRPPWAEDRPEVEREEVREVIE